MYRCFATLLFLTVIAANGASEILRLERTDNLYADLLYATSYEPSPIYRTVIYDDQTYDYGNVLQGFAVYTPYKTADDFEVYDYWYLENIIAWLFSNEPADILVEIFGDSGDGPDENNLLFSETVSENDSAWTDTGDTMFAWPIFEVDIPVSSFYISPDNRYWLSLQSQDDDIRYWVVMFPSPEWWDKCYFYYNGFWYDSMYIFGFDADGTFELHGSRGDDTVAPKSFGLIKTEYR